jgi:hypothetical protein
MLLLGLWAPAWRAAAPAHRSQPFAKWFILRCRMLPLRRRRRTCNRS